MVILLQICFILGSSEIAIDWMMSEIGLNQDAELLSLKAKAISPKIRSICAQFDQLLDAIIKDVNEYIIEQIGRAHV